MEQSTQAKSTELMRCEESLQHFFKKKKKGCYYNLSLFKICLLASRELSKDGFI